MTRSLVASAREGLFAARLFAALSAIVRAVAFAKTATALMKRRPLVEVLRGYV